MASLLAQRMKAPDMRNVNGIQLLNLIVEYGPLSRASLAKLSRLSKPTVSEQVQRLIALGTVVELGEGESSATGGKRPTMLAFHANTGHVGAVSIGPGLTRISVSNLVGEPKGSLEFPTLAADGPRSLIRRISAALSKLALDKSAASPAGIREALRAIGVGVPGRVDCSRGTVLELGNVFNWRNVDLATPLSRRFDCPVLVDNDVNVALVAELNHGGARDVRSAVLIRLDIGMGAAIAMDRKIHHGSHWAAGEVGHLIPTRTAIDEKSMRGHMETIVGSDKIAARVRKAARRVPALRGLLKTKSPIAALFEAAPRDSTAFAIAEEITGHLCAAVSQHALVCDPETLLLSGEVFEHVLPEIQSFLARTIPWFPRVALAELGEDAVLKGATDLALASSYGQLSRELQMYDSGLAMAAAGA
ncbi:MAG: ROK family transcriptional regulator [Bryobacterales bacterium]|nr:ROK family transcriptional regulator [Bryobacterales bacterium]